MTDARETVLRAVQSFCYQHGTGPRHVEPSGVQNVVGEAIVGEIAAALDELVARRNGSA